MYFFWQMNLVVVSVCMNDVDVSIFKIQNSKLSFILHYTFIKKSKTLTHHNKAQDKATVLKVKYFTHMLITTPSIIITLILCQFVLWKKLEL